MLVARIIFCMIRLCRTGASASCDLRIVARHVHKIFIYDILPTIKQHSNRN